MTDSFNNPYTYVIISSTEPGIHNNLGHELFWTRKMLLLLLKNNYIDKNITVVTYRLDRFFLYTNYFNNIITYSNFVNNCKPNIDINTILDLTLYLSTVTHHTIEQLKILGLNENELIQNRIFQNCNTPDFNNYICNLDFSLDLATYNNIICNAFFIIHIRPTSRYIEYLLDFIKINNLNVILFTNLEINYPFKTNNLQTFASLLNNQNCLGLLSEWSGGGQLSQFCAKKVIYYYDEYPQHYFDDQKMNYETQNNDCFWANWDHYNPINAQKFFITRNEFLDPNKLLSLITGSTAVSPAASALPRRRPRWPPIFRQLLRLKKGPRRRGLRRNRRRRQRIKI